MEHLAFKTIISTYVPLANFLIVWHLVLHIFFVVVCFPPSCFFSFALFSSFSNCYKSGLVVMNSLSFCVSIKFLTSLLNLNEGLAGQSIPGKEFFSSIILNVSCHSLLICRVSVEKSADKLMVIIYNSPILYLLIFFLFAFNIVSFYNFC